MNLDAMGDELNAALDKNVWMNESDLLHLHALQIAEEAGEAVGAYRRYSGTARRKGTLAELADELADVLIATTAFARRLGLSTEQIIQNKLDVVYSRGWKET